MPRHAETSHSLTTADPSFRTAAEAPAREPLLTTALQGAIRFYAAKNPITEKLGFAAFSTFGEMERTFAELEPGEELAGIWLAAGRQAEREGEAGPFAAHAVSAAAGWCGLCERNVPFLGWLRFREGFSLPEALAAIEDLAAKTLDEKTIALHSLNACRAVHTGRWSWMPLTAPTPEQEANRALCDLLGSEITAIEHLCKECAPLTEIEDEKTYAAVCRVVGAERLKRQSALAGMLVSDLSALKTGRAAVLLNELREKIEALRALVRRAEKAGVYSPFPETCRGSKEE